MLVGPHIKSPWGVSFEWTFQITDVKTPRVRQMCQKPGGGEGVWDPHMTKAYPFDLDQERKEVADDDDDDDD